MISEVQAGAGPTYYQDHFRWRNDDGDALSATWKAPQDVAITNVPHYQNIRLRFCISNVGQGFGNYWHDFVYSTSTNGPGVLWGLQTAEKHLSSVTVHGLPIIHWLIIC
jgi:hypothetical protein